MKLSSSAFLFALLAFNFSAADRYHKTATNHKELNALKKQIRKECIEGTSLTPKGCAECVFSSLVHSYGVNNAHILLSIGEYYPCLSEGIENDSIHESLKMTYRGFNRSQKIQANVHYEKILVEQFEKGNK